MVKDRATDFGGASKRMVDDAVKHGETTIQDATDYFNWATNQSETSTVKYTFVAKEKYDDSQEELAMYAQGLLTLKGTMKVHCVVGIKQNQVRVRETSCFWLHVARKRTTSPRCVQVGLSIC